MNRQSKHTIIIDSVDFNGFVDQAIDEEMLNLDIDEAISDLLAPSSVSNKPILRRGSRGSAVIELQRRLTEAGFPLETDGIFGSNTNTAVREFQRRRGLAVDGIVGPNTWSALLSSGGAPPPAVRPSYPTQNLTSFKRKVRDIAIQEWKFFGRGSKKEDENGAYQRVGDFWKQGLGRDLDGRDTSIPWSAAFISWVMRQAGAGNKFKYSALHANYIRDAIQKRKSNTKSAGFKGYRLHEVAPQVGDLVCASRGKNAGKVGYDTTKSYSSHCDIVVATRPGEIDVIGGNVSNSVSKKTLRTDSHGRLKKNGQHWFTVIKNLL